MAPLGGTGSLGGTGQTNSSRGSGGSAQGHDAPLVKTVFSKATTKTLQEVFSAQGKDPTSWWEFRAQVCNAREREREREKESFFRLCLPLLDAALIKTNFRTHAHTHTQSDKLQLLEKFDDGASVDKKHGVTRKYDPGIRGLYITVTSAATLPKQPLRLNLVHPYIVFQCMVPANTSGFRCSLVMTDTSGQEKTIFFSSMLKSALLNNPLRKCLPLPLQTVYINMYACNTYVCM
jgi:hypothetical protein